MSNNTNTGFTLVETLVSVSLFAILVVGLVGTFISMLGLQGRTHNTQIVLGNINTTIDSMVRRIREGTNYDCDPSSPMTFEACVENGSNSFAFSDKAGDRIVYSFDEDEGAIFKKVNNEAEIQYTTAKVVVEDVTFNVFRDVEYLSTGADYQPRVVITVRAHVGNRDMERIPLYIQTGVSERLDPSAFSTP